MKLNRKYLNVLLLLTLSITSSLSYATSMNQKDKEITDDMLRQLFIVTGNSGIAPHVQYGGIVLFKNDILTQSPCNIKKQSHQTSIFIDQEGGTVLRLPQYALLSAQSALKLPPDNYYTQVKSVAKGMVTNCIDVNLAPVVEMDEQSSRSYGEDYDKVVKYASIFSKAMQSEGISTVLKHFPGQAGKCHQTTNLKNIGLELKVNTEAYTCKITDMKEFKKDVNVFTQVPSNGVMLGQGIYENFSDYPAFMEPKMRNWLVEDLKYKKVLISDALWEIEATPRAIMLALKTVDWVMVGQPSSVEKALPELHNAINEGRFTYEEILHKLVLINEFKNSKKN